MAFTVQDLQKIQLALLAQRSAVTMSADSFRSCGDAFDEIANDLFADAAALKLLEEKLWFEIATIRSAELVQTV